MTRPKVATDPWLFTNKPPLPTTQIFRPGFHTPKSLQEESWSHSPPLCSECGHPYERPQKPFYFCSSACKDQWTKRLGKRPFVPMSFKNIQWEGRREGKPPPQVQENLTVWNKELDGDRRHVTQCGATMRGFPTNEYPLNKDNRGKTCSNPAGWNTDHPGSGHCRYHGGAMPNHTKKAQLARAEEEMRVQNMIYGTPIEEISPEEAILQELARTAGHVQWLYEKMQEVGEERGQDAPLEQSTKLGRTPAVWVDLYQRERSHLVSVAKTASTMGIQERQIKLAEEQGQLLAAVIRSFMNDPQLGLTPQQMVDAPEVMRRHLAAIPLSTTPKPRAPSIVQANGMTAETNQFVDAQLIEDDDPED